MTHGQQNIKCWGIWLQFRGKLRVFFPREKRYSKIRLLFTGRILWWPGNRFINQSALPPSVWWSSSSWRIFYVACCKQFMVSSQKCLFMGSFLAESLLEILPHLASCLPCLCVVLCPDKDINLVFNGVITRIIHGSIQLSCRRKRNFVSLPFLLGKKSLRPPSAYTNGKCVYMKICTNIKVDNDNY